MPFRVRGLGCVAACRMPARLSCKSVLKVVEVALFALPRVSWVPRAWAVTGLGCSEGVRAAFGEFSQTY